MVFFRRRPLVETGVPLSDIAEGEIVTLVRQEGNTNFIVAQHQYESRLNDDITLLVDTTPRGPTTLIESGYVGSGVDNYLTGEYYSSFSGNSKQAIINCAIAYTPPRPPYEIMSITRYAFTLSAYEFGVTASYVNQEGDKIDFYKYAPIGGYFWTRSFRSDGIGQIVVTRDQSGASAGVGYSSESYPYYACIALKSSTKFDPDTRIIL